MNDKRRNQVIQVHILWDKLMFRLVGIQHPTVTPFAENQCTFLDWSMEPVLSLRPFLFTPFSHDNSIIKINPWNRGSTPIQVRKPFEFGVVCSNLMYWARPATEQLKVNATKFQWVSLQSLGVSPWPGKLCVVVVGLNCASFSADLDVLLFFRFVFSFCFFVLFFRFVFSFCLRFVFESGFALQFALP